MEKTVLYGTILVGLVLVVLQRFFPDFVTAWFSASDTQAGVWRSSLLVVLLASAIARELTSSPRYMRMIWCCLAIVSFWATGWYVAEQPVFMFDMLYWGGAACFFAIAGLQTLPSEFALPARPKAVRRRLARQWRLQLRILRWSLRTLKPALHMPDRHFIHDSSHVLQVIKS